MGKSVVEELKHPTAENAVRLALFLGADASRFIEMPTTIELMNEIKEWVRGRKEEGSSRKDGWSDCIRNVDV